MLYALGTYKRNWREGDMLIFENKDLRGFPLFLGEQTIEYWQAANRGLIGRQSTL